VSKYLEKIGFEELSQVGLRRGYLTQDDIMFFMPRFTSSVHINKTTEKLAALGIEIRGSEIELFSLAKRIQEEKRCSYEDALFEANIIESEVQEKKRAFRKNYFVLGFILSRYGCIALIVLFLLTLSVPAIVFFMLMSGLAGP